jgi:hypothetical protein
MPHGFSRGRPPGGPFATRLIGAPLGVALVLVVTGRVLAHGPGGPWLIIEPYQVNPGGTVEVRGDNLGADEEVTISLVVGGESTDLGVGTSDGEGHLEVFVTIPADVPAAGYGLIGRTASGSIARGTFTVAGPPIVDQGGGDPYERGPIGTLPPAPQPQPAAGGQGSPIGGGTAQSTVVSDVLLLVAALTLPVVTVLGMIGWRRRAVLRR